MANSPKDRSEADSKRPTHETVLALLSANESVIPPAPDAHPVSTVYNREAVVPPQCYTRTEGYFNPCYVCHQNEIPGRENSMNDQDLQVEYSFSDLGTHNHWKNLFEDRSERVGQISDSEILEYVNQENYSELSNRLEVAEFNGWIPDLENLHLAREAFDSQGFAKDGSHWVAFNYKPVPSTFWPTNGSTDDVMIRLPKAFREDESGSYSRDIYMANLSILEAKIKGQDQIRTLPIDEKTVGIDLDQDGQLGVAKYISKTDNYVGAASGEFIETHLYPKGTEFLHTIRYLGFGSDGHVEPSRRIKEVRYMKKWQEYSKQNYHRRYDLEGFEKEAGNLPGYKNLGQWGFDNGNGWSVQGFIEDKHGRLRANTFEENFFCMGCHNTIGSTIDKTFAFARKLDGPQGWSYIDLHGMPDAPNVGESQGEILTYLERVGGGSEFRNNEEMEQRWFKEDGTVDHEKVAAAEDVYELIAPSKERALVLNKAYKAIVEDQDFIYGRDATVQPPANVYSEIDNLRTPTLPEDRVFEWDIRLDWSQLEESGTRIADSQ
ncbi:hypothetical protein H5P27_16820 [Pelagicoccus albus]|uniref:Uncharacterized protein n=1 Tax=Pelagicoccus albus TaxID=415222 RepID=A0A7X1B8P6_9BACT|nr:hypothetical protein [Pelagicoccus albus]